MVYLTNFESLRGRSPLVTEDDMLRVDRPQDSYGCLKQTPAFESVQYPDNSNIPFPWKLHAMLDAATDDEFEDIVSWERGGKAFKVHDSKRFVVFVLPRFFNQTRYKSFQRQLNIYGFTRVAAGKEKGLLSHKCFVRGNKALCVGMQRTKIKGFIATDPLRFLPKPVSYDESSGEEPKPVSSDESSGEEDEHFSSQEDDDSVFDKAFFEGKSFYLLDNANGDDDESLNPSPDREESVPNIIEPNVIESPEKLKISSRNDSFPWKLYDMLEQVTNDGHIDIVSWENEGKAFRVHKPKEFVEKILPLHFLNPMKWESFQRQLNFYDFVRITRGPQKGKYFHKIFQRGDRSICRHITRAR